ncbi:MAG: DUF6106 family protein [Bacillota bacterium]|nr:DUF6106 family protein [Bacillota bacterium]
MEENSHEQLIKTDKSSVYNAVKYASFGIAGIGFLMFYQQPPLSILLIVIGVALFIYKRHLYVEYEYILIDGEMDIDKIFEMSKRKTVVSFNVKEIELLALEDSNYVKDFSGKPSKIINAVPKDKEEKAYIAMVTGRKDRFQLRFLPDEKILDLLYKYCPRSVK